MRRKHKHKSEHFTLPEIVTPKVKRRIGKTILVLFILFLVIASILFVLGVKVRFILGEELSVNIKQDSSSYLVGSDQAVDLSLPGLTSAELYNHIYTNISSWDQLIWEFPERGKRSWVHVSYSSRRRRKTTLASDIETYHDLYGGKRWGSTNQYQHGINDAKIV